MAALLGFVSCLGIFTPVAFGVVALANLFAVCNEYVKATVTSVVSDLGSQSGVKLPLVPQKGVRMCIIDTKLGANQIRECHFANGSSIDMCYNHFRPHSLSISSYQNPHFLHSYKGNLVLLYLLAVWTALGTITYAGIWGYMRYQSRKNKVGFIEMNAIP
jgi:hypothetical protein